MSDLERLRSLVGAMRELGVVRCRLEGVEVVLGPAALPAVPAETQPAKFFDDELPPDDLLSWSVAGPLPSEIRDAAKPPEE